MGNGRGPLAGVQSSTRLGLCVEKRLCAELVVGLLREAEVCLQVEALGRGHGFSDASCYLWRRQFGGMMVPATKRLRGWRRRTWR